MVSQFRILLVDDDADCLESWGDVLDAKGYHIAKATSAENAMRILSEDSTYHLAILDLMLPGMSGLELLQRIRSDLDTAPAVIMATAFGSIDSAVKAMKLGAENYLVKPVNPEELLLVIEKERQRQQIVDLNAYFMRELCEKYKLKNIIGQSPSMLAVFEKTKSVAASDASVMIIGESGTGKELFANHIHYFSARQRGPLVIVSCSTLAASMVEDELFGHEKNAFTGATSAKPGRFELAHGGTLFLDEVGDIPLPYQTKLLRVLESGESVRLGGTEPRRSDFRIISAANHDLRDDIKKGLFRADLFYRLAAVEIELPPLRERQEDIPFLFNHFNSIYAKKMNKHILQCSAEVYPILQKYSWPGNVRELKNIVERAFVYSKDSMIGMQDLPRHLYDPEPPCLDLSQLSACSLDDVEKQQIERCLWACQWNRKKAAQILGITRTTLDGKLKRHGLAIPRLKEPEDEN